MSHSRFTRMPGFLAALTVSFCAVAQADPADTIFAAENASTVLAMILARPMGGWTTPCARPSGSINPVERGCRPLAIWTHKRCLPWESPLRMAMP